MFELGVIHGQKGLAGRRGTKNRYHIAELKKSVSYYQVAAEHGSIAAMIRLGDIFFGGRLDGTAAGRGYPVQVDESIGFQSYMKAAESSSSLGQYLVAIAYTEGRGTEKNTAMAASFAHKALERGFQNARKLLMRLSQVDDAEIVSDTPEKEAETPVETPRKLEDDKIEADNTKRTPSEPSTPSRKRVRGPLSTPRGQRDKLLREGIMMLLAGQRKSGKGRRKGMEGAMETLDKAAALGSMDATFLMCCIRSTLEGTVSRSTFYKLDEIASQGHAAASTFLGNYLRSGLAGDVNDRKVERYLRKGAVQQSATGKASLALWLLATDAKGGPQVVHDEVSAEDALPYLVSALQGGSVDALVALGLSPVPGKALRRHALLEERDKPSAVRSLPLGVASFLAPSTALLSERSQRYSPIKERRTPRLDRRLASVEKADESFALDDAQLAHITKRKGERLEDFLQENARLEKVIASLHEGHNKAMKDLAHAVRVAEDLKEENEVLQHKVYSLEDVELELHETLMERQARIEQLQGNETELKNRLFRLESLFGGPARNLNTEKEQLFGEEMDLQQSFIDGDELDEGYEVEEEERPFDENGEEQCPQPEEQRYPTQLQEEGLGVAEGLVRECQALEEKEGAEPLDIEEMDGDGLGKKKKSRRKKAK